MSHIFISYSHTDSTTADEIVATLDSLGIRSFRDVKNIEWREPISTKVREGLQSASALIVIISPGSLKSQWVAYEVGYGTGTNKRVFPYLTHPALDMPGFMSDLSYVKSIDQISEFFSQNEDWRDTDSGKSNSESNTRTVTLNDMQVEYLMTISKPRNEGVIYGGIDDRTGRDVAPYQEALELYQSLELMRYGSSGYQLTPKGWKLVDQLWTLAIADALQVDQYSDDSSIAEAVGLTDGQPELDELHRHVDAMKSNGLVNSRRTNSGVSASLTQKGATYRKHRPINI